MNRILFHKLRRTMLQYKAQFLSMILMMTLGVGIFAGFNMEWYSIERNTDALFSATGYADYRIYDESGFSEKDLQKIEAIEGVEAASRYLTANVDIKEREGDTAALSVTENPEVSGFLLKQGEEYDAESRDGIWLSEKYAAANAVAIGDQLTFEYSGLKLSGTVKGLIQSGEHMICVRDSSQLMPDYETHGFAYISPAMLKKAILITYYPQINVISDLSKQEFTEAVDEALGVTSLILTKEESISYAGAMGEAEEGKTMGAIVPVVFLLIAILTMVTTMHRLTLKERMQIGTLKALGFRDRQILMHYTSYAAMIGVVGSVVGIALGYLVAGLIMNENGMMGTYMDMPEWKLYMPWFCWLVLGLILIIMIMVGYLSVRSLLQGTAADTLRNDFSEKQRKLRIEKTAWFHRRSFGTRWNLRDMARHKSRTAMSLIGVAGCTIIIIAVLGMQDTMDAFLDNYYNDAMNYASRIYLTEDVTEQQLEELTEKYGNDIGASVSVQIGDKAVSLDIYDLLNHAVRFPAEKDGYVELQSDGGYVCRRIADEFGVGAGDTLTVSPYGSDQEYTIEILGISRSVTESIMISSEYAGKLGVDYTPDSIYSQTEKSEIGSETGIRSVQSRQMIMDSFDSFMEIMNIMVAVMILAGIVLGIVVLYSLGVMSYAERYREMATLKVLGFKDRKIGGLLAGQNLWLSLVGVLIGIPLGAGLLVYLMDALAPEYELLISMQPSSFGITILLTFGMSLLVSLMVARKNRSIDMVEALKSAE